MASPVELVPDKNKGRQAVVLLQSSGQSWLRASLDTQPNLKAYPQTGFPVEGERKARPLAVSIQGSFASYFRGKPSPLQASQAVPSQRCSRPPLTKGLWKNQPFDRVWRHDAVRQATLHLGRRAQQLDPQQKEVKGEEPRIGVFICRCGNNIGGVVDVPKVKEYAASLGNVVFADTVIAPALVSASMIGREFTGCVNSATRPCMAAALTGVSVPTTAAAALATLDSPRPMSVFTIVSTMGVPPADLMAAVLAFAGGLPGIAVPELPLATRAVLTLS